MGKSSKNISRSITNFLFRLARDERGQSTTEYILMLAIVVMIAMKFKDAFLKRITGIVDKVGSNIDNVVSESN